MSSCALANVIDYPIPFKVEEESSEKPCLKRYFKSKPHGLQKRFALIEYKDQFWLAYHLGLNFGKRTKEGLDKVNQAVGELNNDFYEYAKKKDTDKYVAFTENFNVNGDKRVSLIIYEINQATTNLGESIISGNSRNFYLLGGIEPFGRRGIANEFNLDLFVICGELTPNIPEKLFNTGLLYESQYTYKPWLYAVNNRNISITDFLLFVEDLRTNFIEIGSKNLSTIDYLLCRVDCWGKKAFGKNGNTHKETMSYFDRYLNTNSLTYKGVGKQAITVLEYDNWLSLEDTKNSTFRTFKDTQSFLEGYAKKGTDYYKYLRKMLNYYTKAMNYSVDLSATLAVIELRKKKEYEVGFTKETREGIARECGMSLSSLEQYAKKLNYLPYTIYDLYMKLYVLPVYKDKTYLTTAALCAENPNIVFTKDKLKSLLKGDSLDYVFK